VGVHTPGTSVPEKDWDWKSERVSFQLFLIYIGL
jgi:hypothetical protein